MRKEIITAEKDTPNNRKYSLKLLENIKEQILNKETKFGELDFPDSTVVSLSRVSHRYSNPEIENGTLFVEIDILNTPNGEILKTFIDSTEFKLRGCGDINKDGYVNEDYEFVSIDAVSK